MFMRIGHVSLLRLPLSTMGLFHLHSRYSVSHNFIYPSKELCSKMDLGEVGVSLP